MKLFSKYGPDLKTKIFLSPACSLGILCQGYLLEFEEKLSADKLN